MKAISFSIVVVMLTIVTTLLAQQNRDTRISLTEFETKLNQLARPQILDVRSPAEYKENHLKHAVNLDVKNGETAKTTISTLDKQKPVFVYSINNGRSGVIARQLREQGFNEVYELPGGIAHWIGAGKPIESKAGQGISIEEFKLSVAAKDLVLVDVGSRYCGGCKKLEPVVDSIEHEQTDLLKLIKVELYDNRTLIKALSIESVPTLILYKAGKVIWKKSGNITKAEIQNVIDHALSVPSCEGADELMKKRVTQNN